jgi:hypothetical protein
MPQENKPMTSLRNGPGVELVALAQDYAAEHRISFTEALRWVRNSQAGAELVHKYNQASKAEATTSPAIKMFQRELATTKLDRKDAIASKVDDRARQITTADPKVSYGEACRRVFAADPALRKAYAEAGRT